MSSSERRPKLIKFPIDLYNNIVDYQNRKGIKKFSHALYELVRRGLESDK